MEESTLDLFDCPICPEVFLTVVQLETHIGTFHNEMTERKCELETFQTSLVCPICSLEFKLQSDLILHSQLHFDDEDEGEPLGTDNPNYVRLIDLR